jgi:flotillin
MFAAVGAAAAVGALAFAALLRQFIYVCRPSEMLIFSGREQKLADGGPVGYRVVHGGAAFRFPLLEKVERMDLSTMAIDVHVANALSKGGIPLAVHAIANVKVSSDHRIRANAIEQFLGADPEAIRRAAKEQLEGHLRGVLSTMTPEKINEDRQTFGEELAKEASEDFDRLGLTLDNLKIQSVSDDVSYLDSIGRERLAQVLSAAEQAESTAKADTEAAQAEATRAGQVANQAADGTILQRENELRRVKAELEQAARSEEVRAEQAALAARAKAEQRLQEVRARLENVRLTADVRLPADAAQQAAEMKARADAAQIAADGEALAEVLRMMSDTWVKAGADAKDIFLMQQIEQVLATVTAKVQALQVGSVTLVDGGDGSALPQHVASLPAVVSAVFREFRHTTGVDVTRLLNAERPALPAPPLEVESTPVADALPARVEV